MKLSFKFIIPALLLIALTLGLFHRYDQNSIQY